MITLSQLTELLGWASILNITYLVVATLTLVVMKGPITSVHKMLFDIDEKDLSLKYFNFLSNYKIATLVFMVAPYISLKLMGQ
jgi:EamA domain-containing membrane protein RarD